MNVFHFLLFLPNPITIFLSVFSLRCLPQLLGLLSSSFNANSFVVWLFPTRRRNAWKRRSSPPQWAGRGRAGCCSCSWGRGRGKEARSYQEKLKRTPRQQQKTSTLGGKAFCTQFYRLLFGQLSGRLKPQDCVFAIYYMRLFLLS